MKLALAFACLTAAATAQRAVVWPKYYELNFTISLPYIDLLEDGRMWYDETASAQRIEYYAGMDTFISAADATLYEVVPVVHEKECFELPQAGELSSLLPDMSNFTYVNSTTVRNIAVDTWRSVLHMGDRVNTYTMYVATATGNPVRFDFLGADLVLGSHYDHYVIEYLGFAVVSPDPALFREPKDVTCRPFPGTPGAKGTRGHKAVFTSPFPHLRAMFPGGDSSHTDAEFDKHAAQHGREYVNEKEARVRKQLFVNNLRLIDAHNRKNVGYQLAVNHLFDFSPLELRKLRGRQPYDLSRSNGAGAVHRAGFAPIPDTVDWVAKGAVLKPLDQAICGSCWSFGAAQTIAGTYFLKTGNLISLSEQSLVDCTWPEGNTGCDGGLDFQAYRWIMKNGIASDEQYGPYIGQDSYCHHKDATKGKPAVTITGYVNVTVGSVPALKDALANKGPISISIDASPPEFSFYAHGVFTNSACSETNLDHTVLAVGYGTDAATGLPYVQVQNSWSTHWGDGGRIYFNANSNTCGMATSASYVTM